MWNGECLYDTLCNGGKKMKLEMSKTIKPTIILCGIGMVIGLFFDYRISLGLLLGTIVSILHLAKLEQNITAGLSNNRKVGGWIFMFVIDLVILAIPFVLAILLPQVFNLFGVAIGLLLNKVVIYGMNLFGKEK